MGMCDQPALADEKQVSAKALPTIPRYGLGNSTNKSRDSGKMNSSRRMLLSKSIVQHMSHGNCAAKTPFSQRIPANVEHYFAFPSFNSNPAGAKRSEFITPTQESSSEELRGRCHCLMNDWLGTIWRFSST